MQSPSYWKPLRWGNCLSLKKSRTHIILGEVKTDSKSNEVTAIPLLLALLDLEDATISIDAIACNETIVKAILDKGANYLLGLKKNQPTLYAAVEDYVQAEGANPDNLTCDYFDDTHGRLVRRRYFVFDTPEHIKALGFSEMNTVIATETISSSPYKEGISAEWRYYITNNDKTNTQLPRFIRDHWQIESTHWLLDVHLNDDKDKKYSKNAAENFAKTKRFLLNMVKLRPPKGKKRSVRANLKLVGWNLDYLEELIFS
ncbi:ISAs1 family transposase [Zooshikella ganghwensis]|uniref:ISAs1 family transposase n=1 Tax=Zooshikella ganghwensis TaxID=202772 RepID=A0A4P9VQM5_9GAMM|nr:ISAs1 family transposase [Zooshikella ganghwensis]